MRFWKIVIILLIGACTSANADWFLRGTQNGWAATPMESVGEGAFTVQLKNVVFNAPGNIKFDRFGDWKENYGVGGFGGGNIDVSKGTWDIKFFTDTKTWKISRSAETVNYHIRGSFNNWSEGTLMARVGSTDVYESCVNFMGGDSGGGPRFKVDPNGAWGDAIPVGDFLVSSGWVKVSFNATSKSIGVQQNLLANCAIGSTFPPPILSSSSFSSSSLSSSVASSVSGATFYLLRGTNNAWAENIVMGRIGGAVEYEACVFFQGGDKNGGPRFIIDPNGGWGSDSLPLNGEFHILLEGWARVSFNPETKLITATQGMKPNCGSPFSSSSASRPLTASSSKSSLVSSSKSSLARSSETSFTSSSTPSTVYHLRGTQNAWNEGMLMDQIGNTNMYEKCVNFVAGDTRGTRFKIDPNGGWGDAIPANDFAVSAGWVKISFNSTTKDIAVQQHLSANCGVQVFHLRSTLNAWAEGDLFEPVNGSKTSWSICRQFAKGDAGGGPRFKVDPNGGWGSDAFPAVDVSASGWTSIVIDGVGIQSVISDMAPNCVVEF